MNLKIFNRYTYGLATVYLSCIYPKVTPSFLVNVRVLECGRQEGGRIVRSAEGEGKTTYTRRGVLLGRHRVET